MEKQEFCILASPHFSSQRHRVEVGSYAANLQPASPSLSEISSTTSCLVDCSDAGNCPSQRSTASEPRSRLLPLPASASPAPSGGGSGTGGVLVGPGRDVDLSLLDLAAGLRQQVLDLLLRLQVEHHVPELLLQLFYRHVLQVTWKGGGDRRRFTSVRDKKNTRLLPQLFRRRGT